LAAGFTTAFTADLATGFTAGAVLIAVPRDSSATGRVRVVVTALRRADFDAGFFVEARALLADFLTVRREALAGRRAVLVDCVLMTVI
jgi:hypothetical protein